MNYRGEGDYKDYLKWIPRGIGGAYGAMTGGLPGAKTGWDAGAKLSKLVGWGDYGAPVSNQIIDGGMGGGVTVNASDDLTGDIYLSHKEFIGNVTASSTGATPSIFQQTKYPLNAGIQSTFPFLSQLASNFEMFDFQGLIFEYRPTSGENATANSLGKVMMATQYDPDAADWLNSVQLMNYDYSSSTKPSVGMVHGVETANKQQAVNMMYTRTNNETTKSRVFTDLGNFYVATEGIPFTAAGTQILGELWVSYRVKLSRAALYQSMLGLNQPLDTFTNNSSVTEIMPVATLKKRVTNAGLFNITSSTAATIVVTGDSRLIAGCFQWVLYMNETVATTTITNIAIGTLVNISQVNQVLAPTGAMGPYIQTTKTAAQTQNIASGFFSVSNTNNIAPALTFTVAGTATTTAGIRWTLTISQVPCTLLTDPMTG